MSDFFLTLPSNVTKEDKTNNFSVRLPKTIRLDGQWEAALVEIQYPYSWKNISGGFDSHDMTDNWIDITFKNGFVVTVFVPPGYYSDVNELLKAIDYGKEQASEKITKTFKYHYMDKKIEEISEPKLLSGAIIPEILPEHAKDVYEFLINFDKTIKRTSLKLNPGKITQVQISEKLKYMLGFEYDKFFISRTLAKYLPDMKNGFYSLYVYCDLVDPQIVGNSVVPLLRHVHVSGLHGEIIEKIFQSPHYLPVIKKEIDRIKIEIKDDRYQFVPFDFGKVVAKLHFRKKHRKLF